MARKEKHADALFEEAIRLAKEDLAGKLEPILERLRVAVIDLEHTWAQNNSAGTGSRRPTNGRRGTNRAKRQRIPRGSLHEAIRGVLSKAKEPLRLTDIRDELLRHRLFKNRDPKSLYTQIIHALRQMPDTVKIDGRRYTLKP